MQLPSRFPIYKSPRDREGGSYGKRLSQLHPPTLGALGTPTKHLGSLAYADLLHSSAQLKRGAIRFCWFFSVLTEFRRHASNSPRAAGSPKGKRFIGKAGLERCLDEVSQLRDEPHDSGREAMEKLTRPPAAPTERFTPWRKAIEHWDLGGNGGEDAATRVQVFTLEEKHKRLRTKCPGEAVAGGAPEEAFQGVRLVRGWRLSWAQRARFSLLFPSCEDRWDRNHRSVIFFLQPRDSGRVAGVNRLHTRSIAA